MSEFHYVRTRGTDGGVDACEGPAIGLDLETVLKDGLPPWNIALEIVAALCEILDIADEDGEVHGEVHPKYVFIDETGAVSLEGFGVKRRKTRAPEGVPRDTRTDLYGLGFTTYRCFCSHALPEAPPTDPVAHDDMVVDAALEIDLSGVPDAMQGDVQWYVAKLMEFDPAQRPTALEAWRTFVAFANDSDGVDMAEWCASALDGGGARRTENPRGAPGSVPEPKAPEDEELGGPVVLKGPLKNKLPFDEAAAAGAAAKAGATAFWTREDMKKALERADEEDGGKSLPPSGPSITSPGRAGRAATSFWSQDQLDAMARGDQDAPRPRRVEGEGERRRAVTASHSMVMGSPEGRRPPPSRAPASVERGVGPRTAPPPAGPPSNLPPRDGPAFSSLDGAPPAETSSSSGGSSAPAPKGRGTQFVAPGPPEKAASGGGGAVSAPPPPSKPPAPPPVSRTVNPNAAANTGSGRAPTPATNLAPPDRAPPPARRPGDAQPPDSGSRGRPPTPRPPPARPPPPAEEGGGLKFVLFGGGIAAAGVVGAAVLVLALLMLVVVVTWPNGSDDVEVPLPVPPTPVDVTPVPIAPGSPPSGTSEPRPTDPAPGAAPTSSSPPPVSPGPEPPAPPKPPTPGAATPKPPPKPPPGPKPPAPAGPKPPSPPKPPPPAPPPKPPPNQKPGPRSAPGSNARVQIKSSSGGAVTGCSKTKFEFAGSGAFSIEAYTLPATCLVTIDGARGVFTVAGSGDVTCDKQGTTVVCDKQSVP